MKALLAFLNSLNQQDQEKFAGACGTSVGYLRKAASKGQRFDVTLCVAIERESFGIVRLEDVRPDVDWDYIRGTKKRKAKQQ